VGVKAFSFRPAALTPHIRSGFAPDRRARPSCSYPSAAPNLLLRSHRGDVRSRQSAHPVTWAVGRSKRMPGREWFVCRTARSNEPLAPPMSATSVDFRESRVRAAPSVTSAVIRSKVRATRALSAGLSAIYSNGVLPCPTPLPPGVGRFSRLRRSGPTVASKCVQP
jgi:hypothetical protein